MSSVPHTNVCAHMPLSKFFMQEQARTPMCSARSLVKRGRRHAQSWKPQKIILKGEGGTGLVIGADGVEDINNTWFEECARNIQVWQKEHPTSCLCKGKPVQYCSSTATPQLSVIVALLHLCLTACIPLGHLEPTSS